MPAASSSRLDRARPALSGVGAWSIEATVGCVAVGGETGAVRVGRVAKVGVGMVADVGGVAVERSGPFAAVIAGAVAGADGTSAAAVALGVEVTGDALLATEVVVTLGAAAAPATGLAAPAVVGAGARGDTDWTGAATALGRGALRGVAAGSTCAAMTGLGARGGAVAALVTPGFAVASAAAGPPGATCAEVAGAPGVGGAAFPAARVDGAGSVPNGGCVTGRIGLPAVGCVGSVANGGAGDRSGSIVVAGEGLLLDSVGSAATGVGESGATGVGGWGFFAWPGGRP